MTHNISSCGVLFTVPCEPDLGVPIEYVITLGQDHGRKVDLRCVGKVVRCEARESPDLSQHYHVAATLERYEFVRSN